jgi:hypothetical protein
MLIVLALLAAGVPARTFRVDYVHVGSASEERFALERLLGDGYTAHERGKFEKDARRLMGVLFSTSPFKERREDFNVWGLCPPAARSHPITSAGSAETRDDAADGLRIVATPACDSRHRANTPHTPPRLGRPGIAVRRSSPGLITGIHIAAVTDTPRHATASRPCTIRRSSHGHTAVGATPTES